MFLTLYIITEVIRWLVLPNYPCVLTVSLHPFCNGLIVDVFLLQQHPNFLWQYSHIYPLEARRGTLVYLG